VSSGIIYSLSFLYNVTNTVIIAEPTLQHINKEPKQKHNGARNTYIPNKEPKQKHNGTHTQEWIDLEQRMLDIT
jgi:hypothetical protein